MRRIHGISILRNEEYYCALAIENAMALCDDLLILENNSTDRTREICMRMVNRHQGRIQMQSIDDLNQSHEYCRRYADTDTWVLGVDGDEIYDPQGLVRLRAEILSGAYDAYWRIRAQFLHVAALAAPAACIARGWHQLFVAAGWLGPPSHQVSKLYNMAAVKDWPMDPGRAIFQPKRKDWHAGRKDTRFLMWERAFWPAAHFRCVHLRFVPRTSEEEGADLVDAPRHNMSVKIRDKAETTRGAYKQGPLRVLDVTQFFWGSYFDLVKLGLMKEIGHGEEEGAVGA